MFALSRFASKPISLKIVNSNRAISTKHKVPQVIEAMNAELNQKAIGLVTKFLARSPKTDDAHSLEHFILVLQHARKAIETETSLDPSDAVPNGRTEKASDNPWIPYHDKTLAIELAALLHDLDDAKHHNTTNYQNARTILDELGIRKAVSEYVIYMISLVSCRTNGNSLVEPPWLLIPRWGDRLEALGSVGIRRAHLFSQAIGRPLYVYDTPRATTEDQLAKIATPERFGAYRGNSVSLVDHCYDKILHVGKMPTSNAYFLEEAAKRHRIVVDFCLEFGRTGTITPEEWYCK